MADSDDGVSAGAWERRSRVKSITSSDNSFAVNARDAPEAGVRCARRHSAREVSEFLTPDGIFRRGGHRSRSDRSKRSASAAITGVTETDEYAAISWGQVECGLKRIRRFGHESRGRIAEPVAPREPGSRCRRT